MLTLVFRDGKPFWPQINLAQFFPDFANRPKIGSLVCSLEIGHFLGSHLRYCPSNLLTQSIWCFLRVLAQSKFWVSFQQFAPLASTSAPVVSWTKLTDWRGLPRLYSLTRNWRENSAVQLNHPSFYAWTVHVEFVSVNPQGVQKSASWVWSLPWKVAVSFQYSLGANFK